MNNLGGGHTTASERASGRVMLDALAAEDDPRAAMYIGLRDAAYSSVVYGPGDIARCFATLCAVAPVLATSELFMGSSLAGCFPGQENICWTALDGPAGSAIAVHYFKGADTNFCLTRIDMRLRDLPDPWEFFISAGGSVPADFAVNFSEGQAIPVSTLPGLQHLQTGQKHESEHEPEPERLPGDTRDFVLSEDISKVTVRMDWNARSNTPADIDLDISAFALTPEGRVRSDSDFVFYNNPRTPDNSLEHTDEGIVVHLETLSSAIDRVALVMSIYDGEALGHHLGMIIGPTVRLIDATSATELARIDRTAPYTGETAVVAAELVRAQASWRLLRTDRRDRSGLAGVARAYGVRV